MKIKIDKKIWLIIAIVIIVAALVSLFRIYNQQIKEQEQLTTNLATQQALLTHAHYSGEQPRKTN